jgi:hypothetical protein
MKLSKFDSAIKNGDVLSFSVVSHFEYKNDIFQYIANVDFDLTEIFKIFMEKSNSHEWECFVGYLNNKKYIKHNRPEVRTILIDQKLKCHPLAYKNYSTVEFERNQMAFEEKRQKESRDIADELCRQDELSELVKYIKDKRSV